MFSLFKKKEKKKIYISDDYEKYKEDFDEDYHLIKKADRYFIKTIGTNTLEELDGFRYPLSRFYESEEIYAKIKFIEKCKNLKRQRAKEVRI